MTQPSLLDLPASAGTFTEKVAQLFLSKPGVWIDGMAIAQIGGAYAWRSRVSECRQMGMRIDNRQRRIGRRIISEYRYDQPA